MNFRPWRGVRSTSKKQLRRQNEKRRRGYVARQYEHLLFEPLEWRNLMTATLRDIVGNDTGGNFNVPSGKTLYVPLTGSDNAASSAIISYTAQSSNSGIKVEVIDGNPTLVLQVAGKDSNGQDFSGTLKIELFEDIAPTTVQKIVNFVNAGDYDGEFFYRIVPDFVIQGGLGQGDHELDDFIDEFDAQATFNSPGLLAMANPGNPDMNTSEFFITDIDLPLEDNTRFLNFKHTIFGQLTDGFDIYQKIINTQRKQDDPQTLGIDESQEPLNPITIVDATILNDGDQNAVLKVTAAPDFDGTATIAVTASTSAGSSTASDTFGVDFSPSGTASNDRPVVIGPVSDQTVEAGGSVQFTVSAAAVGSLTLSPITVTGTNGFRGTPQNVTMNVSNNSNNTMATVTLTPAPGFSGKIELVVHADSPSNWHDAVQFTLNVLPTIDEVDPINIATGNTVTVSGIGAEGATIAVEISDGTNTVTGTATVGQDGHWTSNAININSLDDGEITYKATDTTNELEAEEVVGTKDTVAPTVSIDAIDFVNNTNDDSFTVTGMSEPGAIITLLVTGAGSDVTPPTAVANQNGEWTISGINLSGFADGTVTFTATAVDAAENPGTAPDTEEATKDTATTVDIVTATNVSINNASSASVSGTAEAGATITLVVTDGTHSTTAQMTTATGGSWTFTSVDLTTLNDGPITYQVTARDAAGNEATDTFAANKAALGITAFTNPVNFANRNDASIEGTTEPNADIEVVISDGDSNTADVVVTTQADGEGKWKIEHIALAGLTDGALTYKIKATDGQENSVELTRTATKDTTAPTITINAVGTITNSNKGSVAVGGNVTGTGNQATTITVMVDDSNNSSTTPVTKTVTVNADGTWTMSIDVGSLADGELTFKAIATDLAENASAEVSTAANKDATAPVLDIDEFTDPVNPANQTKVTIKGNVTAGSTVKVVITDEEGHQKTVDAVVTGDSWTAANVDVSQLEDGELTYTVTAKDSVGNETVKTETATKSTADNSLSGIAYVDRNQNGKFDSGDALLRNVLIQLHGVDAAGVALPSQSVRTGSDGRYSFNDLPPGTYTIREVQPINFNSAKTNQGSLGGKVGTNFVAEIKLDGGDEGTNYNFGERGLTSSNISINDFLASSPSFQARYNAAMADGRTANPVVGSIKLLSDNPTKAGEVRFEVRFNKNVSGVDAADFRLVKKGAILGESIRSVTGSGRRYIVTVNSGTGSGELALALRDNGTIFGSSAKQLGGAGMSNGDFVSRYYTVDATAPGVTLNQPPSFINENNQDDLDLSGTVSNTGGEKTTIKVKIDDTDSSTAAVNEDVEVNADGTWNIDNVDVSDLKDGQLTFKVTATDEAGNIGTGADRQSTKDTVDPALAITSVESPINSTNQQTVTVSGTGEANRTVSVVASRGGESTAAKTATVGSNGNWTLEIDVDELDDGELTFTATVSDAAGNTATDTETASKDVQAPALAITSVETPINNANQTTVIVSGTGEADRTVSVVASRGGESTDPETATVDSNGNWTVEIDVNELDDGTITFTATSSDTAGNTATDTETATKDTVAPTVTINDVDDPINGAEDSTVDVSGTVTGASTGTVIAVTIDDGNNATPAIEAEETVNADGTWNINDIDVSSLDDGTLTFTVVATDAAGNVSAPDSDTATKDSAAPGVTLNPPSVVNAANQNSVDVNGTVTNTGGATTTIRIVIDDGNNATPAIEDETTVSADGSWNIDNLDLSSLDDGTLTFTVTATDAAGNSSSDAEAVLKDTVTTVAITDVTDPINAANANSVTVSGTGEAGATVSVVAGDSTTDLPAVMATVDSNGVWALTVDVSTLADGTITFTGTATDAAGNTATPVSETADKDTEAPDVEITDVTNPIKIADHKMAFAEGTGEAGATVSVVASDGMNSTSPKTATVGSEGTWEVTGIDLSTLADGTITYTVTISDDAGNTATDSRNATKTTVAITAVTNPINDADKTNVSISGTGEVGAMVTVVVSDATNPNVTPPPTTIDGNGNWSITGIDVSLLADGTLTFMATATVGSNSAVVSKTALKDTQAPALTIDDVTDPVNSSNQANTSASGTSEAGATISLFVTDGVTSTTTPYTATADGSGNWTITGIDVSALAEGAIAFVVDATDTAGNTSATQQLPSTKDTVVPMIDVTTATPSIDFSNFHNTSASGTVEVGSTVSVVASDGTNSTAPVVATVDGSGNWSADGIDVSTLIDGTITFTATGMDSAGNSATDSKTGVKSTVLIVSVTDPIVPTIDEATTASGTGQPDASVTVVASDGAHPPVTSSATTIDSNGNWSIMGIDVSGLNDGTITYTATATFGSETATSTKTAMKDTTPPDLTVNSLAGTFINAANETNVSISGTTEPGATVTIRIGDNINSIEFPATVDANGNWSLTGINVSTLFDSTLTFTVTATDAALNDRQSSTTSTKDTQAPAVTVATTSNPVSSANVTNTSASGTTETGATVSVVATDGVTTTAPVMANVDLSGNWTVTGINVSALIDGTIAYAATATDPAGNPSAATTKTATKDTVAPAIAVDDPGFINIANNANFTVSGTGEMGATVTLVISDGAHPNITPPAVTIDGTGNWSIAGLDLSGFNDGVITFTATATDGVGNSDQDNATAVKDILAPEIAINDPGFINIANNANFTVGGTGEVGATVTLVISDGVHPNITPPAVTIDGTGNWSIAGLDLSGFNDGVITFTATAADGVGNSDQDSATGTKDTEEANLLILTATDSITIANQHATTIHGIGGIGDTISVFVTDGVNSTSVYTGTVNPSDNFWTISNIDVSGLADGPVVYKVTSTDAANNPRSEDRVAVKTTVSVTSVTDPINSASAANTSISGKGEVGASIKVVATDGTDSTSEHSATVNGSGDWSISGIDVSTLDNGTITYTVTATDGANNTATVTKTATKDVLAPTVMSITLADASPTSEQTVHFTVVFTEPVTGVGSSSFMTVPGGSVSGVSIDSVLGNGTTYTVAVSFTSGTGTLGLNVDDVDAIFDLSGNPLGGLGNDNGDFTGPEYTIEA